MHTVGELTDLFHDLVKHPPRVWNFASLLLCLLKNRRLIQPRWPGVFGALEKFYQSCEPITLLSGLYKSLLGLNMCESLKPKASGPP